MRTSNRRGMLLLVVLALLAIFAMMSVAFVVMTSSERSSSIKLNLKDTNLDPPEKLVNLAVKAVVTGTPVDPTMAMQPAAAITWQNLLEKEYGFETIGTLSNPCTLNLTNNNPVCGGQLIELTLPGTNPGVDVCGPNVPVDPFHCVGCVLTMLDGPAAGLSTRIVSINPTTGNVQMLAFEGGVWPANGNHYIVNGFPYSGMGFGFSYNNNNGGLTTTALYPNAPPSDWKALGGTNGIIPGGVNTDCTVPDYTDPLVALAVSDGSGGVFVPIPSLHRADLLAYLSGQGIMGDASKLRKAMFRPIGAMAGFTGTPDHPYFTGSNPNFNPLWDGLPTDANGKPVPYQWDVDNMGTGRPDSVWVDLGFPVRFAADGHAYKPLVAILCLEMDGRLNLNAHGSLAQTNPNYYAPQSLTAYQSLNNGKYAFDVGPYGARGPAPGVPASYAGPMGSRVTTPPVALPRGQGTGPAEVNLLPLFRNPGAPTNFNYANYQWLLSGGNGFMGRYGPGIGSALPGLDGTGSFLTLNNAFPYSGAATNATYWANSGGTLDAYGTPPDPQTAGACGLDAAGRALYFSMGGQAANGPYDIDLTRNAPHAVDQARVDNPFSVAEMERILRWPDRDAPTLPPRLANLTNAGAGSMLIGRRAEFTVESNYVPVSAAVLPPGLRFNSQNGQPYLLNKRSTHPVDILYAQITKNLNTTPDKGAQAAKAVIAQLLPWEVIQGLKMDVNRALDAGAYSLQPQYRGQTIYGGTPIVPDQPGTTGEKLPQYVNGSGATTTTAFNYSADGGAFSQVNGKPVNDSLAARQLYARHLYILALSLADVDAIRANWFGGDDESMKRMVAQWAVNVVAYRDHNNIMIPFHYDVNPFTAAGWSPESKDASPAQTIAHTVWGCKRPALLISETLAFHDRRTQDLNDEVVDMKKPGRKAPKGSQTQPPGYTYDTGDKKDPSYNSRYRPQGSLFVEFFNPWPLMEPQTPDLATPAFGPGVDLTKVAPASGGLQASPVWRLVIVDPAKQTQAVLHPNGDELPDPDSPLVGNRPKIERIVYFVAAATASNAPNDTSNGQVYRVSAANAHRVIVAPGGYAVVGSGDLNQQNRTYIGFENGQTTGHQASTRMVDLNGKAPNFTVAAPVVKNTADPAVTAASVPVLGIDSPQRLSVSEPTKGYARYENMGPRPATYSAATGKYSITLDISPDWQRDLSGDEKGIWAVLNNDGTQAGFRILYLQRLADPTRPYVAETNPNPQLWNPYRTVDAMTVDLTCFDGLVNAQAHKDPTTTSNPPMHFESHQRGERNYLPGSPPVPPSVVGEANLWKQEPAAKGAARGTTGWNPAGWSNGGAGPRPTVIMNFAAPLNQSLGYLNKPYGTPSANPPGDPQYPLPLLNWAYRPFNNVYELLLVPTVSSSRLLARNNNLQQRGYYGYQDGAMRANQPMPPVYDISNPANVPYPHLLNFFESGKSSAAGASAQLHRLFYYLGVPSRFANAQLQMQAANAGLNTGPGSTHWFHTPFNRVSRYREPGMINLNTVTSSDVLFGAMNDYPLLQQNQQLNPIFWDKFVRSRRGDGAASPVSASTANPSQQSLTNMLQISGAGPSRFMRPYRTPGGAFLTAPAEPDREADVTLLRPDPDVLLGGTNRTVRPLYEVDDYLENTGAPKPTPDQFPLACMDFNRGPNFRYQLLEKLGSTVSTHSNVFAIWITVGYFEVMPCAVDPVMHPDGYQLGAELGSDTGDITRHRAFFIFDRSLPVGYIRGQDVNTERGFLLKRPIE